MEEQETKLSNASKVIDTEDYSKDSSGDEEKSIKSRLEYWKSLQIMPNKRRFIILSIVFSIIEIAGLLIISYAFVGTYENGLFDFAIFMMAPFTGLAVSYFVENQKEAIGISVINASSSIGISLLIFILVEHLLSFPAPLVLSPLTHLGIPILFILIQILIAFTMSRVRRLYYRYGDSSRVRESDKALIEELKKSRMELNEEESNNN